MKTLITAIRIEIWLMAGFLIMVLLALHENSNSYSINAGMKTSSSDEQMDAQAFASAKFTWKNFPNNPDFKGKLHLLHNRGEILPLKRLDTLKIVSLALETDTASVFQHYIRRYTCMKTWPVQPKNLKAFNKSLQKYLQSGNLLLLSVHATPENQTAIANNLELLNAYAADKKVVVVGFGLPEIMDSIRKVIKPHAALYALRNSKTVQAYAAQAIFGGRTVTTKPANATLKETGYNSFSTLDTTTRLAYGLPGENLADTTRLKQIDSLVETGIRDSAFPGCQILAAQYGRIFYRKSFGYHTYDSVHPVRLSHLYDLASVTKICGPLPALMRLHDQGRFKLDVPFKRYCKAFDIQGKDTLTVREILAHQARLQSWLPFWKATKRKSGKYRWFTVSRDSGWLFPVKIAPEHYLFRWYPRKIRKTIRKSELLPKAEYRYSGLSFFLYPSVIEDITGQAYVQYLNRHFYHRLGAYKLTYNPWKQFPLNQMPPTEHDTLFRRQLIRGYVHDEGAAMLGGVSGNAGLFANADDLAKLMQMYLHKGTYGNHQFISKQTMQEFTSYQFPENDNRRGLGFDKPLLDTTKSGYIASEASKQSFGHSGFTGTFVWMDPENQLLVVFLSNRVYPYRSQHQIYRMDIRQKVHEYLYQAVKE